MIFTQTSSVVRAARLAAIAKSAVAIASLLTVGASIMILSARPAQAAEVGSCEWMAENGLPCQTSSN